MDALEQGKRIGREVRRTTESAVLPAVAAAAVLGSMTIFYLADRTVTDNLTFPPCASSPKHTETAKVGDSGFLGPTRKQNIERKLVISRGYKGRTIQVEGVQEAKMMRVSERSITIKMQDGKTYFLSATNDALTSRTMKIEVTRICANQQEASLPPAP